MNTLIPGAIWKSFGIIFLEVKAKYSASAAVLSWTSSMVMALALFMGKVYHGSLILQYTHQHLLTWQIIHMSHT